mgnify:FL=1
MQILSLLTITVFVTKCSGNDIDLRSYKERVKLIYSLLDKECPGWKNTNKQKRNVIGSLDQLDVEKTLYNKLFDMLIKCRQTKNATSTMSSTLDPIKANIEECNNAINFTQSWRLDHAGRDLRAGGYLSRNGYACDIYTKEWFRFSGAAGSRMLNTCPAHKSCGTYAPYWTDDKMPDKVGERLDVKVYYTSQDKCRGGYKALSVIRCSEKPNDLIYKYNLRAGLKVYPCAAAFCGMN